MDIPRRRQKDKAEGTGLRVGGKRSGKTRGGCRGGGFGGHGLRPSGAQDKDRQRQKEKKKRSQTRPPKEFWKGRVLKKEEEEKYHENLRRTLKEVNCNKGVDEISKSLEKAVVEAACCMEDMGSKARGGKKLSAEVQR